MAGAWNWTSFRDNPRSENTTRMGDGQKHADDNDFGGIAAINVRRESVTSRYDGGQNRRPIGSTAHTSNMLKSFFVCISRLCRPPFLARQIVKIMSTGYGRDAASQKGLFLSTAHLSASLIAWLGFPLSHYGYWCMCSKATNQKHDIRHCLILKQPQPRHHQLTSYTLIALHPNELN